jgi:hypothetical protein
MIVWSDEPAGPFMVPEVEHLWSIRREAEARVPEDDADFGVYIGDLIDGGESTESEYLERLSDGAD